MENGVTMCDSPPICNITNNSNNNGDISNSNNINKVRSGANMFVLRYYIHYRLEKHFARTNILFPPNHSSPPHGINVLGLGFKANIRSYQEKTTELCEKS